MLLNTKKSLKSKEKYIGYLMQNGYTLKLDLLARRYNVLIYLG